MTEKTIPLEDQVWPIQWRKCTANSDDGAYAKTEKRTIKVGDRELSVVLCDFLGGSSEWFSRLGDEFYVDPRIVGPELRRRKTDAQITKAALTRANRRLAEMQPESAILTDICNQSAEALKPLGDSE